MSEPRLGSNTPLGARWQRLCDRLAIPAAPCASMAQMLAKHYATPGRYYHNLDHVADVLTVVDHLEAHANQPLLVELAGWFHDAIYLPGAQDNELRSAALAERFLADLQLPRTHRAEVQRLILITQNHRTEPEDADGHVLIDADLAGLGSSPAVYRRQVLAIRDEYGNVDDETFRQGRIWLLQRFLRWDHIYYTPLMRAEREAQARANLQRELEERQRQV